MLQTTEMLVFPDGATPPFFCLRGPRLLGGRRSFGWRGQWRIRVGRADGPRVSHGGGIQLREVGLGQKFRGEESIESPDKLGKGVSSAGGVEG